MKDIDAEVPHIQVSHDYAKFKFHKANRPINSANKEKIKKSMETEFLLDVRPILVNELFEIMDGQHRFVAAQELGLPIYFITSKKINFSAATLLNANTSNWNLVNYLDMYTERQYPNYVKLSNFMKKHKTPLDILLALATGARVKGAFLDSFKDGNFTYEINEMEMEELINKGQFVTGLLKEKGTGTKTYLTTKNFWIAFQRFATREDIEWDAFVKKFEERCQWMKPMSQIKDYIEVFVRIYNHNKKKKVSVN